MKNVLQIHIPRTAGHSMVRWARWYAKKNNHQFQSFYAWGKRYGHPSLDIKFNPEAQWSNAGHSPIGSLLESGLISREWFDSCYKFAFVRNTWSRLVSCFEFARDHAHKRWFLADYYAARSVVSFDYFIKHLVKGWGSKVEFRELGYWPLFDFRQLPWLQWGVDFIGRFENLDADWEQLCKNIGIEHRPLRKSNKTHLRRVYPDYRDYYTSKLQKTVADFYGDEIEKFGFTFD